MTDQERKELAEFGVEFLGWKHWPEAQMGYESWEGPQFFGEVLEHKLSDLFFNHVTDSEGLPAIQMYKTPIDNSAPILMHLAKREMEKRGFEVRIDRYNAKGAFPTRSRVYIRKDSHKNSASWDWELADYCEQKENEFIAFWSALRKAVKGE
jgi:hypothetical protein